MKWPSAARTALTVLAAPGLLMQRTVAVVERRTLFWIERHDRCS